MGWGFDRGTAASSTLTRHRSRIRKFLLVLLACQVSLGALVFYMRYPLLFPSTGILEAPLYWGLLSSLILSATVFAYIGNSAASSFLATAIFYLAFNSYKLLHYSVPGGDTTGEVMDLSLMSQLTHISPAISPHFKYLETPISYLYALVLKELLGLGDVMATIEIGYLSYFLMLLIAIWGFTYRLGDGFFAYLAAISYLILAYNPLNNQFVPQFLALILLFFLFYTMDREGPRWRAVEGTLFIALVFTHPIFPLLYPLMLVLQPGISSILASYERDEAYRSVGAILLHPFQLLRKLLSPWTWLSGESVTGSGTIATYAKAVVFVVLYLLRDPVEYIDEPIHNPRELAGNPIAQVTGALTRTRGGTGGDGGEVDLLYGLVPKSLDTTVTWGSRVVVLSLLGILLLAFLYNDISDARSSTSSVTEYLLWDDISDARSRAWSMTEYRVEVIVVCALGFLVTVGLNNSYGIRMFQIAFLPVAVLFYGLRKYRRAAIVLIVCLALLSPVLIANAYVNTTITAGGNTIGYHETQAGRTIGDHYTEYGNVVVPPYTPLPVGTIGDPRIVDVRLLIGADVPVPDSGLVIHSNRLVRYLDYRGCDYNLDPDRETVIYDNSAKIVRRKGDGQLLDCPT